MHTCLWNQLLITTYEISIKFFSTQMLADTFNLTWIHFGHLLINNFIAHNKKYGKQTCNTPTCNEHCKFTINTVHNHLDYFLHTNSMTHNTSVSYYAYLLIECDCDSKFIVKILAKFANLHSHMISFVALQHTCRKEYKICATLSLNIIFQKSFRLFVAS